MRASVVMSALVAVLVGFGGSVAVVLAAAKAVGATDAETASWVAALCVAMAVTSGALSIQHKLPIITAWSTPGAALIAAGEGVNMSEAVGAFMLAAALVIATAAFRPIGRLIERIPTAIASAMLAGVLFGFVIAIFDHLQESPALIGPMILSFVLLRLVSPMGGVIVVLALGVGLAFALGRVGPIPPLGLSEFVWIPPVFDAAALIGVGLPLYLVTMASQNLPGFAVLRAADYPVPSRSILTVTGLASLATAGFGAHSSNMAAITASICTGPEAHPDKDKRWLGGPVYAAGYAFLAIVGASLVALFASFPEALIATIAGLALSAPLVGALSASLSEPRDRFAAIAAFAVTASGMSVFGIGAAFWGLVAGLLIYGLDRLWERRPAMAG